MTPRREFLKAACVAPFIRVPHRPVRVAFAASIPGAADAAAAGFTVADSFSDPYADAVAIPFDADLAVEACRRGKHLWIASPGTRDSRHVHAIAEAARRYGRVVQLAAPWRSEPTVIETRQCIASGSLGDVRFCRIFGGPSLFDLLQFIFDDPAPVSITALSKHLRIVRYRDRVVSCEDENASPRIALCGTRATLTTAFRTRDAVAHWRDFLECIRTRRTPRAPIEAARRTLEIERLAKESLDRRETVLWNGRLSG